MRSIENIVFDFGAVVFTNDDSGFLQDNQVVKSKTNASQEDLEKVWRAHWDEIAVNRISIYEFYDKLQNELVGKVDRDFSRELFEVYKQETRPLDAFTILPYLKEKHKIFGLTNIFKEGLEYKTEKYSLGTLFDLVVSSCEYQCSKPDPRIFQILVDKAGIIPEQTLFVDDFDRNTIAAARLGFVVYTYDNLGGLKQRFEELGIRYG